MTLLLLPQLNEGIFLISMDSFRPHKWFEDRNLAEAEIPSDPNLPQLARVLNTEIMLRTFQDALSLKLDKNKLKIHNIGISFVRYRPTRYCCLYYCLDFKKSHSSHPGTLLIAAKVYHKELSSKKITKIVLPLKVIPNYGVSYGYISDIRMLFTFFPNDFAIHQLEDIVDTEKLKGIARNTPGFPFLFPDKTEDNKSSIKVMSYKPGRSCLVWWRPARLKMSSSSDHTKDLYVRIYKKGEDDLGERVYRSMVTLWKSEAKKSKILNVAKPLGYNPKWNILIQGHVEGVPLASLVGESEFIDHIRATARALAGIHKTSFSNNNQEFIELETELAKMEEMIQALTQVIPCYSEKLNQILSRLKSNIPALNKNVIGFIHGDFSMSQVLVEGRQIGVIDFDTASVGDQHIDIAAFLTRLGGNMNETMESMAVEAFCQQYELSRPGILDSNRLAWFQAAKFIRNAVVRVKSLRPGWIKIVGSNLDQAEVCLKKLN